MLKREQFMLEICFSDTLTEKEINQAAQNIADAIVSYAQTAGIAPENSEATTELVYVKGWYSEKQICEHVK